jgi:competence protein ComGC
MDMLNLMYMKFRKLDNKGYTVLELLAVLFIFTLPLDTLI